MERNIELEEELKESLKEYSPTIILKYDAYTLNATKNTKSVSITWPYPLMEVYFDFIENNKKIMSESIEFYDNETQKEFSDYIVYLIKRYFTLSTRVETLGSLLKRKELQVKINNEWHPIYD